MGCFGKQTKLITAQTFFFLWHIVKVWSIVLKVCVWPRLTMCMTQLDFDLVGGLADFVELCPAELGLHHRTGVRLVREAGAVWGSAGQRQFHAGLGHARQKVRGQTSQGNPRQVPPLRLFCDLVGVCFIVFVVISLEAFKHSLIYDLIIIQLTDDLKENVFLYMHHCAPCI